MSKRLERKLLVVILLAFATLSTVYSLIVPPFEASDELWHYPMVKYVADHWSLPVQDPTDVGPWRQEGSQPPLYYTLGALATCWIDTSDLPQVRHLNPHVDSGIATPDGNVNLVVHRPEREAFPWQGSVRAVHVVRFLSVAMATAGVSLTYLVAREVLPRQPALVLGATAIHAFTPMVVFIAGSVNNDNLVIPLSSAALLMLLRLVRQRDEPPYCTAGRYLSLGIILGLAALTKASSLALTLLTALVVVVRALRQHRQGPEGHRSAEARKEFVVGALATLLPLLAIAGWWYLRNLQLYGNVTGLNAFIAILGKRDVPADLAQLWRERHSFLAGYWGNFGGLNVPMSAWVYRVLNIVMAAAGVGLVATLVKSGIQKAADGRPDRAAGDCRVGVPDSGFQIWCPGLLLCVAWALGVIIPWIQWARVTWSSQGRLVFAALPAWSLLLVVGLSGWWPRRLARGHWGPVLTLALFLLGLSGMAPFVWIRPAYSRPDSLTDAQVQAIPNPESVDMGGAMRLLGYDLQETATTPGDQVAVTLYWEALAPTKKDYSVFVHLLDKHDLLVAQRDTLPGLGLLSTTWLEPGFRWADRYVLELPTTAYSPNQAQIEVGLFDAKTGQRLPATDPDGQLLGDNMRFGHVEIYAPPGDLSNPVSVNFADRMELIGYDLTRRTIQPGETVTLTLHWRARRSLKKNYTVSAQLIDASQRKAAQHDSWPLDGAAPTTGWEPGQTLVDGVPLHVFPDTPEGPYLVRIAVYVHQDGEIAHLPVTPPRGRMQATHIIVTSVRVTP